MGQNQSFGVSFNAVQSVHEELVRQALSITGITSISYEEFLQRVSDLNNLAQQLVYPDGEQLMFCVKKNTDSPIIWRKTVKIACILFKSDEKKISAWRLLNLNQFLKVFQAIKNQVENMELICKEANKLENTGETNTLITAVNNALASSAIDNNQDSLNECCICLERKPDILLSCSHSYCQQCIDQWTLNSHTCPLCRTKTFNEDDCWVLAEAPGYEEISKQVIESLKQLLND